VSRYSDKRAQADCSWNTCDQLEPATKLLVRNGVVGWYCEKHSALIKMQEKH